MTSSSVGITGLGYQLPDYVRLNNDPIFDALRRNSSEKEILALFQGIEKRHVLGPNENLVSIMASAAEKAMIDAAVKPGDIDLLIGCAYSQQVHRAQRLGRVARAPRSAAPRLAVSVW